MRPLSQQRMAILMWGGFVLYFIVFIRLIILQVFCYQFFQEKRSEQYRTRLTLAPLRGILFDRTGKRPLVLNTLAPSAFILPRQFKQPDKIKTFLRDWYPDVLRRAEHDPKPHFLWLERGLTDDRKAWIDRWGLRDINFMHEAQRSYPYKEYTSLIGWCDIDQKGIAGLELTYNDCLTGIASQFDLERDARSDVWHFNKKITQQGRDGTSVATTIDHYLQLMARQAVKEQVKKYSAQSGSAIVMNPDSGEILALVSYPDIAAHAIAPAHFEQAKCRAITDCYELGSVMKTWLALAALAEEVVTPDEIIDCEGRIAYFDHFRVENWKAVNKLPFAEVILRSSNIGVAKVALRLGSKLYDHLVRLGFGTKTGLHFPGERKGFVNPPEKWSRSSLIVLSFGYEINASLMQLARAFSIVANGGFEVVPTLERGKDPQNSKKRLYTQGPIDQLKDILELIGAHYPVPGCRVVGKTGTARMVFDGTYSTTAHIYTFGGIIERENYRRVIVTSIAQPTEKIGARLWASEVSAPLFQRIAERMVIRDQIMGDLST